jgi:hypothetical protein
MTETAKGLKPISPEELANFADILGPSIAASQQFEIDQCYFPHPKGYGHDSVFIISNQMVMDAEKMEALIIQALGDFPNLTKSKIQIRSELNSDGQLSFRGIEFPSTDEIPPTYTKLERSPR